MHERSPKIVITLDMMEPFTYVLERRIRVGYLKRKKIHQSKTYLLSQCAPYEYCTANPIYTNPTRNIAGAAAEERAIA